MSRWSPSITLYSRSAGGALGLVVGVVVVSFACSSFTEEPGTTADAAVPDAPVPDAPGPGLPMAFDCDAGFCDDFDEGGLGARWSTVVKPVVGTLELDTTMFVSAPRSLSVAVGATAMMNDVRSSYLARELAAPRGLECSFDLQVDSLPAVYSGYTDIFWISYAGEGVASYTLRFAAATASTFDLREDVKLASGDCQCPRLNVPLQAPLQGQWTRVTVQADFTSASVAYAGQIIHKSAFGGFLPTTNPVIAVGLHAYSAAAAAVHVDNVTCIHLP